MNSQLTFGLLFSLLPSSAADCWCKVPNCLVLTYILITSLYCDGLAVTILTAQQVKTSAKAERAVQFALYVFFLLVSWLDILIFSSDINMSKMTYFVSGVKP